MPSGTVTFKGEIVDAGTTVDEMFVIKFEPKVDAEYPYHIYDAKSGQFKSAHATNEIALLQRNNYYNAIMGK